MGLVEKYSPKKVDELILPDKSRERIRTYIEAKDPVHCLFHGPPGTGKTSTVDVIVNAWYGSSKPYFYKKVNGSNLRRIGDVREIFEPFATTMSAGSAEVPFKMLHIDEADRLTSEAQDSLRVLMEDYKHNCVFVLTTNHYNKIDPAIRSRCELDIFFGPVPKDKAIARLEEIARIEGLETSEGFFEKLYEREGGDMRRIMSVFDDMAKLGGVLEIDEERIDIDSFIENLLDSITSGDYRKSLYEFLRATGIDRRELLMSLYKAVVRSDWEDIQKAEAIKAIAECDMKIRDPTNDVIHLDVLCIKIRETLRNGNH
ncbi:MAG: AAA family ATPase [Candidatus Helarchaeales archaeon]